jgi:hypothetical protein
MSLYSHIERKGDLIDLMVDEVMGGSVLPESLPSGDWRDDLRRIAQRTRENIRSHPWMIAAAFRRPFIGPNALRHIDQSLAAVSELPLPPERKRAVLLAVDTYTLGFVRWEVKSHQVGGAPCAGIPADGPSAEEIDTYLTAQVASGRYPHLSDLGEFGKDVSLGVKGERFEVGLEWLLAGIEAEVGAQPDRA